ncbi:LRAD3 protein, partial [Polyodon spathula]|nr:LRAD3 protein [Polyodon spathula]
MIITGSQVAHPVKSTPRGVPYSLEITGSSPGYVTANRDREFLRGGLGRRGIHGSPRISDPCGRYDACGSAVEPPDLCCPPAPWVWWPRCGSAVCKMTDAPASVPESAGGVARESVPGQDLVALDCHMRYDPSIIYAVIGSAVIFVLVVALLALALHHQRKRSVLLPRVGQHLHRLHQPLLLSRFVIVEPQHSCSTSAASYSTTRRIQLLSGALCPRNYTMDTPPSYSQAVRDLR